MQRTLAAALLAMGCEGQSNLGQDPGKAVTCVNGSKLWNGYLLEEFADLINAFGLGLTAVEETGTHKLQWQPIQIPSG